MKKLSVFAALVVLVAALSAPCIYSRPSVEPAYSLWDRYTFIAVPDDVLFCQQDSTGGLRCIAIPPGSLLLLPNPDDAPVDTLGD